MSLTVERLQEVLRHNGDGVLFWSSTRNGRATEGKHAGTVTRQGYLRIRIDGADFMAHRLVWMFVHGEMPDGELDHINGDKTDNRPSNLRIVTRAQNMQAFLGLPLGRCGARGVKMAKKGGHPFRAVISANGKKVHIGYFRTVDEAHAAYLDAKRKLHILP